ncbi:MAG: single-stranded DNA-binding protein [Candidatus Neomarinimicrobiota bacterium]|nr:single-stranded DNA-binding protein [Candidatus Neomarinimicrobiota bacterium]
MQKSSVNKVILVGHIGNKPEGRYTPNGVSTASFSLATNELWIGGDNEKQARTEWHNIVAWNKLADFATEYLQKGQLVYVEGRIQSRTYKDKENINRRISEIISTTITPLEWKNLNDEKKENMSSDDVENRKKNESDDESMDDLPF